MTKLFIIRFSILAVNIGLYVAMSYNFPAGMVSYNADLALAFAMLPILKCGFDVCLADEQIRKCSYSYASVFVIFILLILYFFTTFADFLEILLLILSMQMLGAYFRRHDRPALAVLFPSSWQPLTYLGLIAEFTQVYVLSVLFYLLTALVVLLSFKCACCLKIDMKALPSPLVGLEAMAQFPRTIVLLLITTTISIQVSNEFVLFVYNILIRVITLMQVPQDVLNIKFLSLGAKRDQINFMRNYKYAALLVTLFFVVTIIMLVMLSASYILLVLTTIAYLLVGIKYYYGPMLIFANRSSTRKFRFVLIYLVFVPFLPLSGELNFHSAFVLLIISAASDCYFRRAIYKNFEGL